MFKSILILLSVLVVSFIVYYFDSPLEFISQIDFLIYSFLSIVFVWLFLEGCFYFIPKIKNSFLVKEFKVLVGEKK